jgi:hypothetical protein
VYYPWNRYGINESRLKPVDWYLSKAEYLGISGNTLHFSRGDTIPGIPCARTEKTRSQVALDAFCIAKIISTCISPQILTGYRLPNAYARDTSWKHTHGKWIRIREL